MRALGYFGPSSVRIVDKPDPRIGSTFGHEVTGVVEETGPAVRSLQRGDRVVVPFNIACGACFFCQRGRSVTRPLDATTR